MGLWSPAVPGDAEQSESFLEEETGKKVGGRQAPVPMLWNNALVMCFWTWKIHGSSNLFNLIAVFN